MRFSSFLVVCLGAGLLAACGSSISSGEGGGGAGAATTTTSGSTTSTTSTTSSGQGGAAPSCPDPASPAVFEVGTGPECFERLTPVQTVPTIQGPQGGFHLWLSVGCADCGPSVVLEYGIKDPVTKTWVDGTTSNQALVGLDPQGWGQASGFQARLPGVPWDTTGQLPEGTHVILSATVLDAASKPVHQAEVEVVLGAIEPWYPPCDENPDTCGVPGGLPCCTFGG